MTPDRKSTKYVPTRRIGLFWGVFFIFVSFIFLYGFFIKGAIYNAAASSRNEESIAELSGSLGILEHEYIELKNIINAELAISKGYEEINFPTFVARSGNVSNLSLESLPSNH